MSLAFDTRKGGHAARCNNRPARARREAAQLARAKRARLPVLPRALKSPSPVPRPRCAVQAPRPRRLSAPPSLRFCCGVRPGINSKPTNQGGGGRHQAPQQGVVTMNDQKGNLLNCPTRPFHRGPRGEELTGPRPAKAQERVHLQ
jgi:hypothetical protein